jgi:hypothetical protein
MNGGSVLWADVPEGEGNDDGPDCEAHGAVDESFAARRLRRWLKGMFGGPAKPAAEPSEGPGREPESDV